MQREIFGYNMHMKTQLKGFGHSNTFNYKDNIVFESPIHLFWENTLLYLGFISTLILRNACGVPFQGISQCCPRH